MSQMGQLTNEKIMHLVDLLLQCPSIQETGTRQTLLTRLPTQIQSAILHHDRADVHVMRIVTICQNYEGGLARLIEAVRFFERDSRPMQALDRKVEELFPQPIPRAQVAQLHQILTQLPISETDLRQLYQSSMPSGLPQSSWEGMDSLAAMLNALAKMSVQPGKIHPLLTFCARSVSRTDDATIREHIGAWMETIAAHLGIRHEDVNCLLKPAKTEREAPLSFPLYLLIELAPKAEAPDCYIVQAWAWSEYRKQRIFAEDTPLSLDAIPQVINALIEAIVDDQLAANNEHPAIEFFLPRALLDKDVDQWVLEDEETLGLRHTVAIRFRERTAEKKYWPAWMNRWNGFDLAHPYSQSMIEKVDTLEGCASRALRLRLEEVICLTLTCPLPSGSEVQNRLFSMLLRSGTPIALWPRQCKVSLDELQQMIETLLAGDTLERLPGVVWKCRKAAWKEGGECLPGNHLTLLWDDPNRLPHKLMYLEAPAVDC